MILHIAPSHNIMILAVAKVESWDGKIWVWWEVKYPCWQAGSFNSSRWGRWSSFQACMHNHLLVIGLLPAWSHNGWVIWEPWSPPAMLRPHWWMHWSEPLFSLYLQRGSDELFSSCIPTGPYIMNSGRGGCHGGVNPFLLKCLSFSVLFVLPWRSIHYSRQTRGFCSLPDCICVCLFSRSQWQRQQKIQRWRAQSWCSVTSGPCTQAAQRHKWSRSYWAGTALWEGHQPADAEREKPGKDWYMKGCSQTCMTPGGNPSLGLGGGGQLSTLLSCHQN